MLIFSLRYDILFSQQKNARYNKMLVTKDTIIGDVIDYDPNAAKIFHMNGMFCTGCPHARSESIADACVAHGMDCDALVKALNEYFESKK